MVRPYDRLSETPPHGEVPSRRHDSSASTTATFAAMWDEAGAEAAAVSRQVSLRREGSAARLPRHGTAPATWAGWVESARSTSRELPPPLAACGAAAAEPAAAGGQSQWQAEPARCNSSYAAGQRACGGVWFAGLPEEDPAELSSSVDNLGAMVGRADVDKMEADAADLSAARRQRASSHRSGWREEHSRRTGRHHRVHGPPLILARSSFGLSQRKLSTFDAMMTTLETMWGVIIFLKFGELVIESGLLLTLAVIGACTLVQVLNSLACSAVATNGLHSGAYKLLVANLGGTWGAATSLLYYLGMTALATVEICGAVEAVDMLLQSLPLGPDYVTTSIYYDTGVLGSLSLVVLAFLRGVNSHVVHAIGMVVIVVLVVTLGSTLAGALFTFSLSNLRTNVHPPLGWDAVGYEQLSRLFTFIYPCFGGLFQPVNKAAKLRTPYTSVPRAMIGAVLFTGTGLSLIILAIAGSGPRGTLHEADFLLHAWPSSYVGLGGTIVVGVGSCVSCLDVAPTILASIADEGYVPGLKALGLHKLSGHHMEPQRATAFTLFLAMPFAWLGGLELVALAAGALFLQMYLTMDLCCCLLAALRSPGWRPRWPNPRSFPLASFAGVATLLCVCVFCLLDVELAPIMLALSILLGMAISWISGDSEMGGEALAGLFYTVALQALHALNEDVSLSDAYGAARNPRSWRPQLLCLIHSPPTLGADDYHEGEATPRPPVLSLMSDAPASQSMEQSAEDLVTPKPSGAGDTLSTEEARLDAEAGAVFALAHHLKEGRGLTVAATVVTRGAPGVCEHDLFVLAKERIMRLAHRARLACFADATVSPDFGLAVGVVINCVGVGALRPNTLLVGWRFYANEQSDSSSRSSSGSGVGQKCLARIINDDAEERSSRTRREAELAEELLQGLERAIGFGKAVLLLCTHAGDAPWDRGYRREHPLSKKSTIDIWWLDQRGALPLIVAHLLQRHEALSCCKLRVFMPTQELTDSGRHTDNTSQAHDVDSPDTSIAALRLRRFLALLRITATHVEVVHELINRQSVFRDQNRWTEDSAGCATHSSARNDVSAVPSVYSRHASSRQSVHGLQLMCLANRADNNNHELEFNPPAQSQGPALPRDIATSMGSGTTTSSKPAPTSEGIDPVTAMGHLNLTIRHRVTPNTLLVITDLPAPNELHAAAPLSYTSMLRRACEDLPPTLFVYGGTAHGEPQVYAHAH